MKPTPPALGERNMPIQGLHSGLTWYVGQHGTAEQPHYAGYLPTARPGERDAELHFYALYNQDGQRFEDRPYTEQDYSSYGAYLNSRAAWMREQGLHSGYDQAVHGHWPAFYAQLQATDQKLAGYERDGYPPRVGAHVGPEPAHVVDGINGDPVPVTARSAQPTPAELALLRSADLHPSDLGYRDAAAAEWLSSSSTR